MTPLSDEPHAFTPSHFLIGRTGTCVPDPDLSHIPVLRLSSYQDIQYMQQQFWRRWSREYITELQTSRKWTQGTYPWKREAMVLIKDDHWPTLKWALGRIVELKPGLDGIVRSVSVPVGRNIIKRATAKLCPLPIEHDKDY